MRAQFWVNHNWDFNNHLPPGLINGSILIINTILEYLKNHVSTSICSMNWSEHGHFYFSILKIENFVQNSSIWNVSKRYLTRKHGPNPEMVHLIVLDALKSTVIRSIQITVGINLQTAPPTWNRSQHDTFIDDLNHSSEVSDIYGKCDITFSRINLNQLMMSKTTQRWSSQLNLNKQKVLEWISNVSKTTIPVSISYHADSAT